jgi:acyl carrier protein
VEREFHVEIPREMLRRETARSMEAIFEAVQAVQPELAAAEWREAA